MLTDLRLAVRSLRRSPGFAAAVIATLAVGIAANSTVFTFVNAVLLRPMPFEEPDRVLDLGNVAYLDMQEWRTTARTLTDVAALRQSSMNIADADGSVDRYRGAYVSANSFGLIGRTPILGRDFRADDDREGAASVAIIGYEVWRTRYREDRAVIGRTVRVNGVPTSIIGVMPDGFAFPQIAALWLPLSLDPDLRRDPNQATFQTFARRDMDATVRQVREELAALQVRLLREFPTRERQAPSPIAPYRGGVGPDTPVSEAFVLMLGAVAFVLLIACANVANLLLVRASARTHDVTVRRSLGATRWHIVRPMFAECVVLALVAAVAALLLSRAGVRLAASEIERTGDAPYWLDFTLDPRTFAFFAVVCFATTILAGLAPAWLTSASTLRDAISETGRTLAGGRRHRRWTSTFVVGQLTLSLVLLSGAGAMIRSLLAQMSVDAGIDTSQLVTMRLDLAGPAYQPPEARRRFFTALDERFSAFARVPVTFARQVPLDDAPDRRLVTDLNPGARNEDRPEVGRMEVSTNYFSVLGTRPVRGRMFTADDRTPVTVINARLAELYFPGVDPIGHRLRLTTRRDAPDAAPAWFTVIGVAQNVRQAAREGGPFDPIAYFPYGDAPETTAFVIARSSLAPAGIAAAIRDQLRAIDPDLPLFDLRTLDDRVAQNQWGQRFAGSMFAVFAAVALLLASIGLYAVTAYTAVARTREIGIRMALGAVTADVVWLVTRRAATQLTFGLALGLAGGVAVARALPSELAGVSGADPGTFVAVAMLLVAVALVAALVPARRAIRLDPVAALRVE